MDVVFTAVDFDNFAVDNKPLLLEYVTMNKAASELGKMAKGVPKHLSKAERKRRSLRLADARKKRWLK
jgi:hypothetical protein